MNATNRGLLIKLLSTIDGFVDKPGSIEDVQHQLEVTLALLDGGDSLVSRHIRLAEADLEEILFTKLTEEQKPAAVHRLKDLRQAISDWLND